MEKRPEQKIPFFVGRTIQNAKKMKNLPVARRTGKQWFPISRKKQHNRTRKQMIWIQKKPTKGAPNFRTHDSKNPTRIRKWNKGICPPDLFNSLIKMPIMFVPFWNLVVQPGPCDLRLVCGLHLSLCSQIVYVPWLGLRLLSLSSFRILCWYCTSCPVYWLPLAVLHRCLPLCGFVWDCGSSVENCPVRLPTRLFSHVCHASLHFFLPWHSQRPPMAHPLRKSSQTFREGQKKGEEQLVTRATKTWNIIYPKNAHTHFPRQSCTHRNDQLKEKVMNTDTWWFMHIRENAKLSSRFLYINFNPVFKYVKMERM